jgi:hypothetical protein
VAGVGIAHDDTVFVGIVRASRLETFGDPRRRLEVIPGSSARRVRIGHRRNSSFTADRTIEVALNRT